MDFNPETLYSLVCTDLGSEALPLTSDLTVESARKSSLLNSLLKKWIPQDASSLVDSTLASFYRSNASCADVRFDSEAYYHDILLQAKSLMHDYLETSAHTGSVLTIHDCFMHGRMGPGASIGTKHTDYYRKSFMSNLSVTDEALYRHYRHSCNSRRLQAEIIREETFGHTVVRGSKLDTVPKNSTTNRTICIEPSLNMYYQLGAGEILSKVLQRHHNIDISLQPERNRAYAKIGSLYGSYATIDLKSASDTISTALVKELLPRSVYATLDFIRSKETKTVDGEFFKLNMFSSMGNGFTFPLQTLIFATLVRAYYLCNSISVTRDNILQYSVFGDDIICRNEAFDGVCSFLEYCGFTVNREKSFNSGSFRESCGSDFFKGYDIRGIYLKESKNETHTYSAYNRLLLWSCRFGIPLSRSLAYLRGCAKYRPIPLTAGLSEGFITPLSHVRHLKRDRNGSMIYSAVRPKMLRVPIDGIECNYDGAVLCTIGGYIREHRVDQRSFRPILKVVKCKTPNWDFTLHPGVTARDLSVMIDLIS
nr:MAG: hypothetical protein 3 [Leviviridae sp.]